MLFSFMFAMLMLLLLLLLFHKCQTLLNGNRSQGWKQTSARPCSIAIGLKAGSKQVPGFAQ
jgi:uncharacterized membrane protein YfcA